MLYTEGLQKVERPKFERRSRSSFSAFMEVPDDAIGMTLLDERSDEPHNYGTDLSTLARCIEAGEC